MVVDAKAEFNRLHVRMGLNGLRLMVSLWVPWKHGYIRHALAVIFFVVVPHGHKKIAHVNVALGSIDAILPLYLGVDIDLQGYSFPCRRLYKIVVGFCRGWRCALLLPDV